MENIILTVGTKLRDTTRTGCGIVEEDCPSSDWHDMGRADTRRVAISGRAKVPTAGKWSHRIIQGWAYYLGWTTKEDPWIEGTGWSYRCTPNQRTAGGVTWLPFDEGHQPIEIGR